MSRSDVGDAPASATDAAEVIDEAQARQLAAKTLTRDADTLGEARECKEGWLFPFQNAVIGSNGIIVNKRTGRILNLGSLFPVERDLAMYDRGYQFGTYDLVVLAVHDLERTRQVVGDLPIHIVEPEYAHGQVWRIPKPMPDPERWKRLEKLPCVFPALALYFHLELLEEVRRERWFEFEALEYRSHRMRE